MPFRRRILVVEDDALMGSLMVGALSNEGMDARLVTQQYLQKEL